MGCEVHVINICTRNGDTVTAESLNFDVDISAKEFYYESRGVFDPDEIIRKKASGTINEGMFISGTNNLVIESFVETRRSGKHTAFLKCIDQDGEYTILKWNITVSSKEVEANAGS